MEMTNMFVRRITHKEKALEHFQIGEAGDALGHLVEPEALRHVQVLQLLGGPDRLRQLLQIVARPEVQHHQLGELADGVGKRFHPPYASEAHVPQALAVMEPLQELVVLDLDTVLLVRVLPPSQLHCGHLALVDQPCGFEVDVSLADVVDGEQSMFRIVADGVLFERQARTATPRVVIAGAAVLVEIEEAIALGDGDQKPANPRLYPEVVHLVTVVLLDGYDQALGDELIEAFLPFLRTRHYFLAHPPVDQQPLLEDRFRREDGEAEEAMLQLSLEAVDHKQKVRPRGALLDLPLQWEHFFLLLLLLLLLLPLSLGFLFNRRIH
ncbi:hypothetical protein MUK42_12977 [Musa troglodytarum]|uniref:Uncharacterized protein n=1 Tax=Musa troglodytarum TaxID=320322 RepID=A0A9E7HE85_9LILI|nr:hypothetical protein MUK42_12977 [Musa troglodytarum]URE28278.1 hypothetical protein MUK42_12977 [Musa troglodytarum]